MIMGGSRLINKIHRLVSAVIPLTLDSSGYFLLFKEIGDKNGVLRENRMKIQLAMLSNHHTISRAMFVCSRESVAMNGNPTVIFQEFRWVRVHAHLHI